MRRVGASSPHWLLEVGCGTGVILAQARQDLNAYTAGLDIDPSALQFARRFDPHSRYVCGDGMLSPFADGIFDVSLCHFLLMWVQTPIRILQEMRRVTRSGGWVMALAEPDYGGRIDHPPELVDLGLKQRRALQSRGVDPETGRQLASYFQSAGLDDATVGILGSEWRDPPPQEVRLSEWETLFEDLGDELSEAELLALRRLDHEAWRRGERVLFVPTFYAWARVP